MLIYKPFESFSVSYFSSWIVLVIYIFQAVAFVLWLTLSVSRDTKNFMGLIGLV